MKTRSFLPAVAMALDMRGPPDSTAPLCKKTVCCLTESMQASQAGVRPARPRAWPCHHAFRPRALRRISMYCWMQRAGPAGDCRRRAQASRGLRPTLKRAGDKPLSMELAATSVADSSCAQGAVVVRTGGGARLDLALDRASALGCHDRQLPSRTGRVADHSATAMLPWA